MAEDSRVTLLLRGMLSMGWYRLAVWWGMDEDEAWRMCNPRITRGEN